MLCYRTGVFAFVLAPLLILFSSRNNFLLWLTNWSYSTFMLLHRWIARLFVIYALVHSLIFVALWKINGSYSRDSKTAWWQWGVVATVLCCVMLVVSILWVRRKTYETFLLAHIVLAVFVMVGMYYHVVLWLPSWGWQSWLYAAIAVWAFDRVARVARIAMVGFKLTKVSDLGGGYMRLDISGVRWSARPGQHAFCYFPTLTPLKPWENHPFSIIPTAMLNQESRSDRSQSSENSADMKHVHDESNAKSATQIRQRSNHSTTAGVSLFIKQSNGITRSIRETNALFTLIEGPYPTNSVSSCLGCDRILLIGGGIGITGLVPWISHHPNVKLGWSVRDSAVCLVEALEGVLSTVAEKSIEIGRRLDIDRLLEDEIRAGWDKVGVVVSGPPEMCDAVRTAVIAAARRSETRFELEIDSFSF